MDGGGSSSTSNQCLKTEFKWSEPSGRGTMDGKPYRFYQHVAGDCLYTLFVYDDPSIPPWFEPTEDAIPFRKVGVKAERLVRRVPAPKKIYLRAPRIYMGYGSLCNKKATAADSHGHCAGRTRWKRLSTCARRVPRCRTALEPSG